MERKRHTDWKANTTRNIMEIYDHCLYCGGPTKKEWDILKTDFAVAEVNRRQAVEERDRLKAELAEAKERLKRVWGYYGRDTIYYCTQRNEARRWARVFYGQWKKLSDIIKNNPL